MASSLDRSRPFGEVYGVSTHRYEQDGKRFDVHGNELTLAAPQIDPAPDSGVAVSSGVSASKPRGKKAAGA